jgi:YggT family protein
LRAILDVVLIALQLYAYVIIASAILSWLIAFNVVNIRNDFVRSILRPIRRVMPNLGAIDISPVILLLLVMLCERIIVYYLYPYVF